MTKRKCSSAPVTPITTRASARSATRATRSATRSGKAVLVDNPQPPKTKKPKSSGADKPQPRKAKKPKSSAGASGSGAPAAKRYLPIMKPRQYPGPVMNYSNPGDVAVIVEYESEFEMEAEEVKKGVEKSIPGIKVVVINTAWAGYLSLEIRLEIGSDVHVLETLNVVSPSDSPQELDLDKTISRIREMIPGT